MIIKISEYLSSLSRRRSKYNSEKIAGGYAVLLVVEKGGGWQDAIVLGAEAEEGGVKSLQSSEFDLISPPF